MQADSTVGTWVMCQDTRLGMSAQCSAHTASMAFQSVAEV